MKFSKQMKNAEKLANIAKAKAEEPTDRLTALLQQHRQISVELGRARQAVAELTQKELFLRGAIEERKLDSVVNKEQKAEKPKKEEPKK